VISSGKSSRKLSTPFFIGGGLNLLISAFASILIIPNSQMIDFNASWTSVFHLFFIIFP
jgi:hypothetical protein